MKVRIKFRKNGLMKYIGHLDLMRYFQKAFRRSEVPIAFSGGFSPHMIMSFANPLGVGLTSDGEYFDIEMKEKMTSEEALRRLNSAMVEGMEVTGFVEIPEDKKNKGMAIVAGADYHSFLKDGAFPADMENVIAAFLAQEEIMVTKEGKKGEYECNIRPHIHLLSVKDGTLFMRVSAGSVNNLKPELVTEQLAKFAGHEEWAFYHHRLETYANTGSEEEPNFVTLLSLGWEIV